MSQTLQTNMGAAMRSAGLVAGDVMELGVSEAQVSKYRNGHTEPRIQTALGIARLCGVPAESLWPARLPGGQAEDLPDLPDRWVPVDLGFTTARVGLAVEEAFMGLVARGEFRVLGRVFRVVALRTIGDGEDLMRLPNESDAEIEQRIASVRPGGHVVAGACHLSGGPADERWLVLVGC